jgi:hypothetical protein
VSAAAIWLWAQHAVAAAICLGAAAWLIRGPFSRRAGSRGGPCASCGLQRTMTKRPVSTSGSPPAPGASTRTK